MLIRDNKPSKKENGNLKKYTANLYILYMQEEIVCIYPKLIL